MLYAMENTEFDIIVVVVQGGFQIFATVFF